MELPMLQNESESVPPLKCRANPLGRYPELHAYLESSENQTLLNKPGHHLNIIVRECCLREYRTQWELVQRVRPELKKPNLTSCSIPGLLPQPLLDASHGFFIRGEFLVVAYFGNSPVCGYQPGDGQLLRRFRKDLRYFQSKPILYRLTDLLPTDFHFLGRRPEHASRGAAYLLENKSLMYENFSLIHAMVEAGSAVTVLVPSATPEEFEHVQHILKTHAKDVPVGLMVETERASSNLDRFRSCEIFFPGPSDLIAEKLSIGRSTFDGNDKSTQLLDEICQNFQHGLSKVRNINRVYTIKDMNHHLQLPPSINRTYIYTTPELYLYPQQYKNFLSCNSLS